MYSQTSCIVGIRLYRASTGLTLNEMRNGKEASAGFYEDKSTIGIEKIEIVEAYDLSNRIPGIQNPNV